MKTVCAYCKKDMGDKEPLDDTRTSHGICPECYEKEMAECRRLVELLQKEEPCRS